MWETVKGILRRYGGRIGGAAAGLTVAILLLTLGFFRTLLIVLCVGAGFVVGMLLDSKEEFMEMLGKILPKNDR